MTTIRHIGRQGIIATLGVVGLGAAMLAASAAADLIITVGELLLR